MRQVIITGGRDYDDWTMVQDVLNFIKPDLVVQGGAEGADKLAKEWAQLNNVECKTYEADWNKFGKGAGPIRNRIMLMEHPKAVVVAFPGGRGTANCVRQAYERNMIILQVHK